jgi:predicted nucleic acid-binding protein
MKLLPINKSILLDADVLIHLTKGERINLLYELFPDRLLILDVVIAELKVFPDALTQVNNMILFKRIVQYVLPKHITQSVYQEYAKIRKETPNIGPGEGYCMAVAKYDDKIIASSNLRDIKSYCTENSIHYITTMDILVHAFQRGIMTEAECDNFIYNVISRGSKLPRNTMKEYFEMK